MDHCQVLRYNQHFKVNSQFNADILPDFQLPDQEYRKLEIADLLPDFQLQDQAWKEYILNGNSKLIPHCA